MLSIGFYTGNWAVSHFWMVLRCGKVCIKPWAKNRYVLKNWYCRLIPNFFFLFFEKMLIPIERYMTAIVWLGIKIKKEKKKTKKQKQKTKTKTKTKRSSVINFVRYSTKKENRHYLLKINSVLLSLRPLKAVLKSSLSFILRRKVNVMIKKEPFLKWD